jgi:hypothetical protein
LSSEGDAADPSKTDEMSQAAPASAADNSVPKKTENTLVKIEVLGIPSDATICGPFWSIRPARALWGAVLGTQVVATLIAVYGLFMTPLGWGWAGLVWGYALVWFVVNDRVKLLAYRIFDPVKAGTKPDSKKIILQRNEEIMYDVVNEIGFLAYAAHKIDIVN